jgi:3',5'-cyclic AMP phosphodiesterase CpdA
MIKNKSLFILLFVSGLLFSCSKSEQHQSLEVAFLGDVHFHDVYAEFKDGAFEGLPVQSQGEEHRAVIRTMQAQLTSTRLFNENYFAFIAALDTLAAREISFVAMPGDISDDGQPIHLRGFREILEEYEREHGMRFFLTPGNHEPVKPYNNEAGKWNFLGEGGMEQPIFSEGHPACSEASQSDDLNRSNEIRHKPICSDEVIEFGYEDLFSITGQFGYTPRPEDLFFETPFSSYPYSDYDHTDGIKASRLENRQYEVCREGSRELLPAGTGTSCFGIPDLSYLIEPVDGLWLLSLDLNVYVPVENADLEQPEDPGKFYGPGNAGYNAMISHKHHLLSWISEVHERADTLGKTVMAFSHYPAADFYDGAEPLIKKLWGEERFQLARMPDRETTEMLASHGLRIHVGAHMHMNDTHLFRNEETGDLLVNVQTPTLAGYVPGFKILSRSENSDKGQLTVETVILDEVPGFNALFPLYETEWKTRSKQGLEPLWNRDVLNSESYREYTNWHLQELSRLRFIPREWPRDIRSLLPQLTGLDLVTLSILPQIDSDQLIYEEGSQHSNALRKLRASPKWKTAMGEAERLLEEAQFSKAEFEKWDGSELSVDFYRLRNAGSLAFRDIETSRMEAYRLLRDLFNENRPSNRSNETSLHDRFRLLFETMIRFSEGDPDRDFVIDLTDEQVLLRPEVE